MRPMETHETQRDQWGLIRLREITGYQLELVRLMETTGNS